MDFVWHGQRVRESTKTRSRTLALEIERKRRRDLEEGLAGIRSTHRKPKLFQTAAEEWLEFKTPSLAKNTLGIVNANLRHLKPVFGRMLLNEITPLDITRYQRKRIEQEAAPKTINLEYGTLRSILRHAEVWERIQKGTRMLTIRDSIGRAITREEEAVLLEACSVSRSRGLLTFVTLAIETGARLGTIRNLQWGNVDLHARSLKWGKDKTLAGSGRVVPLSERAYQTLKFWASQFPKRHASHYVFPAETYFGSGDDATKTKSETDPTKPMGSIKEAWEFAKKRAGRILSGDPNNMSAPPLKCRFHDLRHTAITRMLNNGVSIPQVGKIVGWSAAQQVRMAAVYGHFTLEDLRSAVEKING